MFFIFKFFLHKLPRQTVNSHSQPKLTKTNLLTFETMIIYFLGALVPMVVILLLIYFICFYDGFRCSGKSLFGKKGSKKVSKKDKSRKPKSVVYVASPPSTNSSPFSTFIMSPRRPRQSRRRLPDLCLMAFFKQLKPKDQVKASRVNTRWAILV